MDLKVVKCINCGAALKHSLTCSYCKSVHVSAGEFNLEEYKRKNPPMSLYCSGVANPIHYNTIQYYSGEYET